MKKYFKKLTAILVVLVMLLGVCSSVSPDYKYCTKTLGLFTG